MSIPIEQALNDLLREYGITINDLFEAMLVEDIDVYEELLKRLETKSKDIVASIYSMPWKLVALTLFTIQAFYIVNPSGMYKGRLLDPPRESMIVGNKVKYSGLLLLINRLKNLV